MARRSWQNATLAEHSHSRGADRAFVSGRAREGVASIVLFQCKSRGKRCQYRVLVVTGSPLVGDLCYSLPATVLPSPMQG